MLTPPNALDLDALVQVVAAQYDVAATAPTFVPAGEDSWCYRFGSLWVSVRRDLRGHVPVAYATTVRLRAAGLEFVLAPIPGRDGQIVHRVSDSPVLVFPYVPSVSMAETTLTPADLDMLIGMIGRLHGVTIAAELPCEDYSLSFDDDLDLVLDAAVDPRPRRGPYTDPLQRLLQYHRQTIIDLRFDTARLGASCRSTAAPYVLTHGEPLPANVLRNGEQWLIADWGDLAWGPPERDWSHVRRTFGAAPAGRPTFMRFYEQKWVLSEIAEYGTIFLGEHHGSADDHAMWRRLLQYLPHRRASDELSQRS